MMSSCTNPNLNHHSLVLVAKNIDKVPRSLKVALIFGLVEFLDTKQRIYKKLGIFGNLPSSIGLCEPLHTYTKETAAIEFNGLRTRNVEVRCFVR